MHRIKAVGILSVAKIMCAIYAVLGLIFVPIFLVLGVAGSLAGGHQNPLGAVGAVIFGIFAPFFYAAIGFVGGAIMAWVYNLMAKWFGGIEITIEPTPIA